jgi:hypothetical protein
MKYLNNYRRIIVAIIAIVGITAMAGNLAEAVDIGPMTWTPRADWINVKTDPRVSPHAIGNGSADDTAAIQSALDIMNNNYQNPQDKCVYIPAGTYKITGTLKTTVSGYSIVGCGLSTVIKWSGVAGGAMFWADGSSGVRYLGLVWDGNNIAGCAFEEYSDNGNGGASYYMTGIRHENESFRNFTVNGTYPAPDPNHIYPTGFPPSAIIAGFDNPLGASPVGEVTIFNCCFNTCGDAVYCPVEIFNNFMWIIDGCEFDNNAVGFSGTENAGGGADFAIMNTHFSHSTVADIGLTSGMRGQRITSVGSNQFVYSLTNGQSYKDCWVDSWTNTAGAMQLGTSGQGSIVDCTFTNPPAGSLSPVYTTENTGDSIQLLLSNNTAPGFPGGTGLVHSYGGPPIIDVVPAGSMGGNITSASKTFLNSATIVDGTQILDVTKSPYNAVPDFTSDSTAAIQAAINAAKTANNNSIVYIPGGYYKITSTLALSGGKYTVEGAGGNTWLCWCGGSNGTIMSVSSPAGITVRGLDFSAPINMPGVAGYNSSFPVCDNTTITSLKETATGASKATFDGVGVNAFYYGGAGATQPGGSDTNYFSPGLVLSGLPAGSTVYIPLLNSPLTVTDCGQAQIFSRLAYMNGVVNVSGATNPKTGFLGFAIAEGGAGGQGGAGYYNFTINDNQNILVGPYYSEQAGNNLNMLRGSGTTTGHVAIEGYAAAPTPVSNIVNVNNYAGRLFYGNSFLYGGGGAPAVQINQVGSNAIDMMFAGDFFSGSAPVFSLDTGANLICAINQDNGGLLSDVPNPLTASNLSSLASAMDDFRQLGALDLSIEYGLVNPSGLVAYWKLDETAAPAADSSMSGLTGTWNFAPTFSATAPSGIPYADPGCITLNGTSQSITMGNPAVLPVGTGARTLCAWAKSTTTSGVRTIASFGTAVTGEAMYLGMNGTSLVAGGYNSDLTVPAFWDTNWHFIVLTYDGTTAKLYADGVLKATSPESWNLVHHACYIGASPVLGNFWKGNVDDVRIYNYALSAAQVTALN